MVSLITDPPGAGAATVDFRSFPISNIEIHVVKGAGSAVYGSMAGEALLTSHKKGAQAAFWKENGPNDWRRHAIQGNADNGLNADLVLRKKKADTVF